MSKIKYCCVCENDVVKGSYIRIGKHCLCKSCEAQIIEDVEDSIHPLILDEMHNRDKFDVNQYSYVFEDFISEEISYQTMCSCLSCAMVGEYICMRNSMLSVAIDKLNELQEIIDSK